MLIVHDLRHHGGGGRKKAFFLFEKDDRKHKGREKKEKSTELIATEKAGKGLLLLSFLLPIVCSFFSPPYNKS